MLRYTFVSGGSIFQSSVAFFLDSLIMFKNEPKNYKGSAIIKILGPRLNKLMSEYFSSNKCILNV